MRALSTSISIARLGLVLALALAPTGALAQDVDAGLVDAGEIIPDAGPGEDAGLVPGDDAGAPADEQPDIDIALPEGHEPTIELTLAPDHDVMTGDVVTATITVTLAEGDDVAVPRQEFGTLELHDQRHDDHRGDGDRHVFVFELDFLMLEPGDQELPPVRLRIVTADGVVGTTHTEARTIHVGSLIANEPDAQPRAASQPVSVMEDDYTLAYVLGALGLVLVGALIAWLVLRWYRAQPKALPPPPPPRPAWEVALEKIEALRKRLPTALADGKQVEVVDGVSDALREYLGGRFEFNGLESTTDEVIARVRHQRLGPIALEEIVALLGDADLVKFAKAVPDEETCKRMIEGSVRIVRGTMAVTTPAITQPARPAGGEPGERASKPPKRKKSGPGSGPVSGPVSGVDEQMLAEAAKSQAAADAALAGSVREDGRREVPDTNPPPAPKTIPMGSVTDEAAPEAPSSAPTPATPDAPAPTPDAPTPATSPSPSPPAPSSPWRESPPTIADGSRDPNDPERPR